MLQNSILLCPFFSNGILTSFSYVWKTFLELRRFAVREVHNISRKDFFHATEEPFLYTRIESSQLGSGWVFRLSTYRFWTPRKKGFFKNGQNFHTFEKRFKIFLTGSKTSGCPLSLVLRFLPICFHEIRQLLEIRKNEKKVQWYLKIERFPKVSSVECLYALFHLYASRT